MDETDGTSAFGASLAGRGFDFYNFFRQPQTIVRLLSWLFSMVVFACITTEGYVNTPHSPEAKCIFNQSNPACHYAVGIGVIGFLASMAFLLLDVYVPFMSNAQQRKYAVMVDMGFSGVWAFLWFVCFCLLANQWSHTQDISGIPVEAAHATVAFSFFSFATWGVLIYFAVGRFQGGAHEVTVPTYAEPPPDHHTYPPTYAPASYNPTPYTPTTYTAYPSSVPDTYKQPPFTSSPQPQGDTGYHSPVYPPPNY